ncbi:universal stress protein [Streptomyces sp. FH025]|uniref:universal stress protein n=1 Tax=Streptomyces sp. FH025 TaxID=2815937 RepID=UPI001A9CD195|nr:universal stress protein [Streptomyces sp. FH025]MBO1415286.1 universal stress protein [Streptomyces sp. FH025]
MDLPVTVGIDGSDASLAAADWAAREALLRERPLRVLHALALMPHRPAGWAVPPPEDGGTLLHETREILAGRYPQLRTHTEQAHDLATATLTAAAEDAELLVLGARGDGGFPGLRVGSTALYVAGRAGCPTVLLPVAPPGGGQREQVVVGVDARRPADAALAFAFAAAQRYRLPVRALHTYPAGPADRADLVRDGETELLTRALAWWTAAHPQVEVILQVDAVGAGLALVEASAKARLLVVGRYAPLSTGRLGPVAHAVLHHAGCPVAVVPGT